jgi:hypothetical protein
MGVPRWFGVFLFRNCKQIRTAPDYIEIVHYKPLFQFYKPNCWLFEMYFMLEKVVLVGLMGFLDRRGLFQAAMNMTVVMFFLLLIVRRMPSKMEEYNKGNIFSHQHPRGLLGIADAQSSHHRRRHHEHDRGAYRRRAAGTAGLAADVPCLRQLREAAGDRAECQGTSEARKVGRGDRRHAARGPLCPPGPVRAPSVAPSCISRSMAASAAETENEPPARSAVFIWQTPRPGVPDEAERRQPHRPLRRHPLAGFAAVEIPLTYLLRAAPPAESRVLGPAVRHAAVAVHHLVRCGSISTAWTLNHLPQRRVPQ